MLFESFLGFIRAVERFTAFVLAGAGMVATNNQVTTSVVLADQCVPDGFAGTAHAHGQRQEGELGRAGRELRQQQLITTDASEVIHIARLSHSNDWVDQKIGFDSFSRA